MVLAQWSRWLDGGRGTSDNMHVKELVVTTQALQGGNQSTVESPLQHRERLSKSLNKEMDFRQS